MLFLLKIGLFSVLSYDCRGQKALGAANIVSEQLNCSFRTCLLLFYLILFRDCEMGKSDNLEIARLFLFV